MQTIAVGASGCASSRCAAAPAVLVEDAAHLGHQVTRDADAVAFESRDEAGLVGAIGIGGDSRGGQQSDASMAQLDEVLDGQLAGPARVRQDRRHARTGWHALDDDGADGLPHGDVDDAPVHVTGHAEEQAVDRLVMEQLADGQGRGERVADRQDGEQGIVLPGGGGDAAHQLAVQAAVLAPGTLAVADDDHRDARAPAHARDEGTESAAALHDALVEQIQQGAASGDGGHAELVAHLAQRGDAVTLPAAPRLRCGG